MAPISDPSWNQSTATSLLRRVQHHDERAWQALTHLYGPLVFYWCRRLGLENHDAADVFQEVFVNVARTIERFRPNPQQGTFRGWLWRITRNKIIDRHRQRRTEAQVEGGTVAQRRWTELPDPFTDDSIDPQDQCAMGGLVRRALELIQAEFEPTTWQAFWRSAVEQQPTEQIAHELSISRASVRQAKSRVLRKLRMALGDLEP